MSLARLASATASLISGTSLGFGSAKAQAASGQVSPLAQPLLGQAQGTAAAPGTPAALSPAPSGQPGDGLWAASSLLPPATWAATPAASFIRARTAERALPAFTDAQLASACASMQQR